MRVDKRIVDNLVIRGDCPCEPCVSKSWMKMRALLVSLIPGIPGYIVFSAFDSAIFGIGLIILGVWPAMDLVTNRINEVIEEQGHTCELHPNTHPQAGGGSL